MLVPDLFADICYGVNQMNMLKAECSTIHILRTEVQGNDLEVTWTISNTFVGANLENANFKNAILMAADFGWANLTNADLSGADLRLAYFDNADLSNTNLDGANLGGAILDNTILTGANLKCINHPICERG